MGIYWRAVTPTPPAHEMPTLSGQDEIGRRLATASALLGVTQDPFPFYPTRHTEKLARGIARYFGHRSVDISDMPMAVRRDEQGRVRWNGPRTVLPALQRHEDNPWLTLLDGVACTAIDLDGGHAIGVWICDTATGRSSYIATDAVVVAADALRTPQLLAGSGIALPALGRNLNEHVVINAQVMVKAAADTDTMGCEGIGVIPARASQMPWHWEVSRSPLNEGAELLSISLYVPTRMSEANRIDFQCRQDALNLPRMSVNFSYDDDDLLAVEQAERLIVELLPEIGDFKLGRDLVRLKPGAALHYTGTVRMGVSAEESVCDPRCRVWGVDNLFVVGNGTLPNPLSCNPTLAGMALAARIGESVVSALA